MLYNMIIQMSCPRLSIPAKTWKIREKIFIAKQLVADVSVYVIYPFQHFLFFFIVYRTYQAYSCVCLRTLSNTFGVTFHLKVISVICILIFGGEMLMFLFFLIWIYWLDNILLCPLLHKHLIVWHTKNSNNRGYTDKIKHIPQVCSIVNIEGLLYGLRESIYA